MTTAKKPYSARYILYRTWTHMMARCYNPKETGYEKYGGCGISVCERWHKFDNFMADMGPRPSGMTLDRWPDGKGNYGPDNCRWATIGEQIRNRSITVNITHNGLTMCVKDWADHIGMKYSTLKNRMQRGWEISKCLTVPPSSSNASMFRLGGRDLVTGGQIHVHTRPYKKRPLNTDKGTPRD